MLIIFDLDDTLIETTKCLVPYYLSAAYEAMGRMGPLKELLAINEKALTSTGAVTAFWQTYSGQLEILERGLEALKQPLPQNFHIDLVPDCLEVLGELHEDCRLALVTRGEEALQLQKVEKAGIQQSLFSKLVVSGRPSKKSDYQKVVDDLGQDPKDVIVCGDRIPLDLTPAKELGFFTVHFENGRGKTHKEPQEDVDLSITMLKELTQVLRKI